MSKLQQKSVNCIFTIYIFCLTPHSSVRLCLCLCTLVIQYLVEIVLKNVRRELFPQVFKPNYRWKYTVCAFSCSSVGKIHHIWLLYCKSLQGSEDQGSRVNLTFAPSFWFMCRIITKWWHDYHLSKYSIKQIKSAQHNMMENGKTRRCMLQMSRWQNEGRSKAVSLLSWYTVISSWRPELRKTGHWPFSLSLFLLLSRFLSLFSSSSIPLLPLPSGGP